MRFLNNFKYRLIKILKIYNTRALFSSKKEPILVPEFKKIIELSNNLAIQNNSKLYFYSIQTMLFLKIKIVLYNILKSLNKE